VGVTLLYSRLQVSHFILECVKFEFNAIILLCKKNDSEQKQSAESVYDITKYIVMNKVINI